MLGRLVVSGMLILSRPAFVAAQSIYTPEMVRDLPATSNLFALIETAQPEVTTDRFNSGGLNAGDRERASAFLASWTQSQYLIGDSSISSPMDGTPMLFPDLPAFGPVSVSTATRGLEITLRPRLTRMNRSGTVQGFGSGGGLSQSSPPGHAPAIAQLGNFAHLSGIVSGAPLDRLEFTAGGVFTRSTTFERTGRRRHEMTTVFASGEYAFTSSTTVHTTALIQPDAWHIQSTYNRAGNRADQWRTFGSYTRRTRDTGTIPAFRQADRLIDGPIPSLIESPITERRAAAGARGELRRGRHQISGGLDAEHSAAAIDPIPSITIAERVDGLAARFWRFTSPGRQSTRHATLFAAFANDRVAATRNIAIDLGLRIETADASAAGAATGISWRSLLPSAHVEWKAGTPLGLELLTGVSRIADKPLLEWLAHGDPAAPTAGVYPWDGGGEGTTPAPLIMRVGPGTGGDATFSAIDPDLRPPVTDQFILQLTSRPRPSLRLRVTGLARRQSSLLGLVNTGVPISGYSTFTIPDDNADLINPKDDQQLTVFERRRDTFGQDRYLLTNPDVEHATMGAVVVTAEVNMPRVLFRIGGTASASVGSGGNRGFTAFENDQSVLGELFTNPNAQTYARGRLFNDRAYTIKSLAILRFPSRITVGTLARYQDGQPFSRLVVVPFLNQGAEAIQAFPRGRSRFSYRATLDVRVQKSLIFRQTGLDLIVDAYNLLNAASEVEEYVVTGPRFREITAIQPSRAIHLGARVSF